MNTVTPKRPSSLANLNLRMVKFGGSLFNDGFPVPFIVDWLSQQSPAINLAITGGGIWADAVRELDHRAAMPAKRSHWLAVRSMSVLTWAAAHGKPEWQHCEQLDHFYSLVGSWCEPCREQSRNPLIWLDVRHFLREVEPASTGTRLPIGWQSTSDSIAARIAEVIAADELVLFKSAPPPTGTLDQLARASYVDDHFPHAATSLAARIRFEASDTSGLFSS